MLTIGNRDDLTDDLPIVTWQMDLERTRMQVNQAWYETTGLPCLCNHPTIWEKAIHPDDRNFARNACLDAFSGQRSISVDYRLTAASGGYRWVRHQGKLSRDVNAEGSSRLYVGVILDVQAEHEAREELKNTESAFRLLNHTAGIEMWRCNLSNGEMTVSSSCGKILGYEVGEIKNTQIVWEDMLHPESLAAWKIVVAEYLSGKIKNHRLQIRARGPDGLYKWLLMRGHLIDPNEEDGRTWVEGMLLDANDFMMVNESFNHNEQCLLLALDNANMAWFSRDLVTNVVAGSSSLAAVYGLENPHGPWHLSEIQSKILPEDRAFHLELTRRALSVDYQLAHVISYRVRRAGGEIRYVEVRYRNEWGIDRPQAIGIVLDITELRLGEIALRNANQRLETAMEHANMAWAELDLSSGVVTGSSRLAQVLCLPESEQNQIAVADVLARLHPEDGARFSDIYVKISNKKFTLPSAWFRDTHTEHMRLMVGNDGGYRWLEGRYRINRDETSERVFLNGLIFDTDDARKTSEALRESQFRLRFALESAGLAAWHWSLDRDVVATNDRAGITLFGLSGEGPWSIKELLSKVAATDSGQAQDFIARLRTHGSEKSEFVVRINAANGEIRSALFRTCGDFDVAGNLVGIFSISADITDRKKSEAERSHLQNQLLQAQKMEAIGLLTGGIAHDFNNILGSILGYSGLALDRFGAVMPSKLVGYIEEVRTAGERARELISQMLAFSRGEPVQHMLTSIRTLVETSVKMLRPALPTTISFSLDLETNLPPVMLDQTQVQQVLVNFCINARDAMEGAGKLLIRVNIQEMEDKHCNSCHAFFSGQFVVISVEDSGPGISAAYRDRIFEPFFSTKPQGQGAGMGLAIAHGIAHRHDGHLLVESAHEKGCCMKFLLPMPVAEEPLVESKVDMLRKKSAPAVRSGHILIVDDESSIANFVGELLEMQGYRITVETDSGRALALLTDRSRDFSLLLTDQTMPGLSGIQLAATVLRERAKFPIIIMTGYSASVDEKKAENVGIRAFLRKPLRGDELLEAIDRILEEEAQKDSVNKLVPLSVER